MKKARVQGWFLCFLILILSGCGQRVDSDHVDKAAAKIVKELEKGLGGSAKSTVAAMGFERLSTELPKITTRLLEERLNHHLSRSERFQVVEVDEKATKLIMNFLKEQTRDLYKQSEAVPLGEFKNLQYIVTGSVALDREMVQVTAKLTQLKTKIVAGSSVATFPLRTGAWTYIYWIVVAGLVCLVGYRVWRRFRSKPDAVNPNDFREISCSKCGRKIKSRYQVGGKCTIPTCENEICTLCWNGNRVRYCSNCSDEQNSLKRLA